MSALRKKLATAINKVLYYCFRLLPIGDTIVFQSEGDCSDNPYALFEYLCKWDREGRYKKVWICSNPSNFSGQTGKTLFLSMFTRGVSILAPYYCATARLIVTSHSCWYNKRKNQFILYTTHSTSQLKAVTRRPRYFDRASKVLACSKAGIIRKTGGYDVPVGKSLILGQPRLDYLFEKRQVINFLIPDYRDGDKVILAMETFRSVSGQWVDGKASPYCLNVVHSYEELCRLNDCLINNNQTLLIKPHHLQDVTALQCEDLDRIRFITDAELRSKGVQLYELVKDCAALLTDYSSVYYDFLLLDRPIGFSISDMADYSRGFAIDDPVSEMPGIIIKDIEDLIIFLGSVSSNIDPYHDVRKELCDKYFVYKDGKNRERILDWVIDHGILDSRKLEIEKRGLV